MSKKNSISHNFQSSAPLPLDQGILVIQNSSRESKRNFVEAVDMILVINQSVLQSDALIRGTISLPHGTGKIANIAVFTKDASQRNMALEAGASEAGAEDLVSKIENNKVKHDFCLASAESMSLISKVAKKLGPRGLMPTQKDGTIGPLSQEVVSEFLRNRTRYKSTKYGVVQCRVGLISQSPSTLADNIIFAYKAVISAIAGTSRSDLFASKYIKSTMGRSQKITIEL